MAWPTALNREKERVLPTASRMMSLQVLTRGEFVAPGATALFRDVIVGFLVRLQECFAGVTRGRRLAARPGWLLGCLWQAHGWEPCLPRHPRDRASGGRQLFS